MPNQRKNYSLFTSRTFGTQIISVMKKAKLKAAKKGILFFDRVSYGDDGKRIVEVAEKHNFDLIVIGSRGMGAAKEIFLGSTSNYVLHKSKKPVMMVK